MKSNGMLICFCRGHGSLSSTRHVSNLPFLGGAVRREGFSIDFPECQRDHVVNSQSAIYSHNRTILVGMRSEIILITKRQEIITATN